MPTVITGTDGINQVQAGAVESGDLPAGSVIQVKHVVTRTSVDATASGVPIDLGLSITIDPVSSSSKFLLICKIQSRTGKGNDPSGYGIVWLKNSSEVRNPGDYFDVYTSNDVYSSSHFQYLDEPSTSSTITYEAKPELYNTSIVQFSQNGNFDHNLTVMEIAG